MGLLEKSEENKRVARECLEMKTYNAGISRAYYAAFQRAEYHLRTSGVFRYQAYLVKNGVENHISHGKMQSALVDCLIREKKRVKPREINVFDELYRKRRLADYSDQMFGELDLKICLTDLDIILAVM
ncbi:hypothetical protein FACS1894137_11030 [Spirochaetia bacterium]|nr:hypothetical protein FACS1894137_11030 [Spirochaetia bacterium]